MKNSKARYLKSATVVLALIAAAYISEVVAVYVAYDMCCRSSAALKLLPIPMSIFDVVRLPILLLFRWSTTLMLYFFVKHLFNVKSLVARLALVFFSIATASFLNLYVGVSKSYYSKYGGRVIFSGGFPSETQIELVTWRSVTMWLLVACIFLAMNRCGGRKSVER